MMRKKTLVTLLLALFACSGKIGAQKIHAIVFCNTLDESIGESCENDRQNAIKEIGYIADYIGYECDWYNFAGQDCSRENLMNTLNTLNAESNDIVFFYYSGHGGRSARDTSKFPQMCLKYSSWQESKFVAVHTVQEMLNKKPARLNIIMTDCCNSIGRMISPKLMQNQQPDANTYVTANEANYRKLFVESKGTVVMTGSKQHQNSLAYDKGGAFTLMFWDELAKMTLGKASEVSWGTLVENTRKATLDFTGNAQEPYAELKITNINSTTPPPSPVNTTHVISATSSELANEMSKLFDKSKSLDSRLAHARYINQAYFTDDAQVISVGRDLQMEVGIDDAYDYLRHLCTAKNLKQVNILSDHRAGNGKLNLIRIHEIRIKE